MIHSMTCYSTNVSDGLKLQFLCDGTTHVEKSSGFMCSDFSLSVVGACDKSCKSGARQVDIQALYRKTLMSIVPAYADEEFADHVALDNITADLLVSGESVIGIKFRSWYEKRGESGKCFCLGMLHISVSERTDWHSHDVDDGVYTQYSFTSQSCDGSCKPKRVKFSKREKRELQTLGDARGVTLPR